MNDELEGATPHWLVRRLANSAMSLFWAAVTASLLAVVHLIWPHQGWIWGMAFGAVAGASAVFITVLLASRTRLPRLLGVSADG